jgi:hypothetical protein
MKPAPVVPSPTAAQRRSARGARLTLAVAVAVPALSALAPAHAHHASEAYISFATDGRVIEQRIEVPLRDLDRELVLDADGNGELRWGEVRRRFGDIIQLVEAGIGVRFEGATCRAEAARRPAPTAVPATTSVTPGQATTPAFLDQRRDGTYAVIHTRWSCERAPTSVRIDYRLFVDSDAGHRGLLRLPVAAGQPADAVRALRPGAPASSWAWPRGVTG